jgi:tRNA(Leu) C34 or U34 (ribose-2'-O)-methylase TrmL
VSTVAPYRKIDEEKDSSKVIGKAPSLILVDPRFARNVGVGVRAASAYGLSQVWFTGKRVGYDVDGIGRLPREERLKGYREVEILHSERPFDRFPQGTVPVAIEVKEGVQHLYDFQHPENAVYVFGPEDGSIPSVLLRHCHQHVIIPTRHCLNLAVAIGTVLYDRNMKRALAGKHDARVTPGEWEQRGRNREADKVDDWLGEDDQ